MAQNEEKKGVLPEIIVAVVLALLVGGTAPWWWKEISRRWEEIPKAPPIPVQGGQIQVRCTPSAYSVRAGGQVGIRVLAFTEQNSPISGASVRIEAAGGWFSSSGTTTEIGQTGSGGVFMTQWRSPPPPASRGYGMIATVDKNGFIEGRCEFIVPIQ